MSLLCVGDVHGKVEIIERALAAPHAVLFMGDFVDSYDRTTAEELHCLQLVFDAVAAGKAKSLIGNHELSYMFRFMRCSGWHEDMQFELQRRGWLDRILQDFHPFLYEPHNRRLFTHAGISRRFWEHHALDAKSLGSQLRAWWANKDVASPFFHVGRPRGGGPHPGGPMWSDISEFQCVTRLEQVFGHSRLPNGIECVGTGCWAIDCLDKKSEGLLIDDEGGFSPYDLSC